MDNQDPFFGGFDDLETVEDESELCDCDPKYKETQTIQKSSGVSFGGFGGQVGDGETVIVCKNCGKMFEVEDTRQDDYVIW